MSDTANQASQSTDAGNSAGVGTSTKSVTPRDSQVKGLGDKPKR